MKTFENSAPKRISLNKVAEMCRTNTMELWYLGLNGEKLMKIMGLKTTRTFVSGQTILDLYIAGKIDPETFFGVMFRPEFTGEYFIHSYACTAFERGIKTLWNKWIAALPELRKKYLEKDLSPSEYGFPNPKGLDGKAEQTVNIKRLWLQGKRADFELTAIRSRGECIAGRQYGSPFSHQMIDIARRADRFAQMFPVVALGETNKDLTSLPLMVCHAHWPDDGKEVKDLKKTIKDSKEILDRPTPWFLGDDAKEREKQYTKYRGSVKQKLEKSRRLLNSARHRTVDKEAKRHADYIKKLMLKNQ